MSLPASSESIRWAIMRSARRSSMELELSPREAFPPFVPFGDVVSWLSGCAVRDFNSATVFSSSWLFSSARWGRCSAVSTLGSGGVFCFEAEFWDWFIMSPLFTVYSPSKMRLFRRSVASAAKLWRPESHAFAHSSLLYNPPVDFQLVSSYKPRGDQPR